MRQVQVEAVHAPLKQAFAISRGAKTSAASIRVTLKDGDAQGRGECIPYPRYGETIESVQAEIEAIRSDLVAGLDLEALQTALPAGAARCAVDCALWDLSAKQAGRPVYEIAGLPAPKTQRTTMTLSLDTPGKMAIAARQTPAKILKLKLGGAEDLIRVEAVHRARPEAQLILDGNEGIAPEAFAEILSVAETLGVTLIEQPFPTGADHMLQKRPKSAVRICADESVHTRADLASLAEKYDAVNIKIDKAGGFTEGLAMAREAKRLGLDIMIGCMVGGSLSMAPAFLLSAYADIIDLDGPLWLAEDIEHGLIYEGGTVAPPSRDLWG